MPTASHAAEMELRQTAGVMQALDSETTEGILSVTAWLTEVRTLRRRFCVGSIVLGVRNALLVIASFSLLSVSAGAQLEVVEIEQPQLAKSIKGVVNDPTGAALSGVVVEERSADWKDVLRSTETDDRGRFHLPKTENKTVYYIEFSRSGFDFVRIKIQLDKKAKRSLVVKMPIAT